MASTMHHLAINQLYYEKYLSDYTEEEKNRFLLGAVAPDCGKQRDNEDKRRKTHFIENKLLNDKLDLSIYVPDIDKFIDKYQEKLDDPYIKGYLVHLITDKFWFEVVMPIFVRKSLDLIDGDAKTINELKHQSYVNWYYDNVYPDFDIHDIIIGAMIFGEKVEFPNLLEFDLNDLLIDEVEKDNLSVFLEESYERLKFIKDISDEEAMEQFLAKKKEIKVADLPTISEFINKCVDYCFEIIDDN